MASAFGPQANHQVKAKKPASLRLESSYPDACLTRIRISSRSFSLKASKLYSVTCKSLYPSSQARALKSGIAHHPQGELVTVIKRHPYRTLLSRKDIEERETCPVSTFHAASNFIAQTSFQEGESLSESRLRTCRAQVSPNKCMKTVPARHWAGTKSVKKTLCMISFSAEDLVHNQFG